MVYLQNINTEHNKVTHAHATNLHLSHFHGLGLVPLEVEFWHSHHSLVQYAIRLQSCTRGGRNTIFQGFLHPLAPRQKPALNANTHSGNLSRYDHGSVRPPAERSSRAQSITRPDKPSTISLENPFKLILQYWLPHDCFFRSG